MPKLTVTSLREKIERHSIPIPWSGCWLWTAYTLKNGYGHVGLGRRGDGCALAHRASWMAFNGPIPDGKHVLHKCDVRCCVNPEHLFLGTQLDNSRDMDSKGRRITPDRSGERNSFHKLTEWQASIIKNGERPASFYARLFGVAPITAQQCRAGRTWKNVK